ncbi:MAG: iron-containing alcohol dehydrogenase, partial [Armatimonadia bacterium]|nr:iron-containing alcohol dehydrogenase [Armatimonadia bacterium]
MTKRGRSPAPSPPKLPRAARARTCPPTIRSAGGRESSGSRLRMGSPLDWQARLAEVIGRGFSTTTRVELGMGAIGRLPRAIEDLELPRRVLLIAQPETWEAASAPVQAALRVAGMKSQVHITTADSVNGEAAADIELVLRDNPLLVPAAIGSGTVNDLVKMAAQEARVPYISVATAASMNGYPSPISAVLRDGLKSTVPAAP